MSARTLRAALLVTSALVASCAGEGSEIVIGVYSALPFMSDAQIRGVCIEVESRGLPSQRFVAPVAAGVPPRRLFEFRVVPRDEDLSQPVTVTVTGRTRAGCSLGVEVARRARAMRFIPNEQVIESLVLGGADPPVADAGVDAPPVVDVPPSGACPAGLTSCAGMCTNTQYDPRHCGGCNVVCPATTFCVAGGCSCPAGQSLCDGTRCTDPRSDPDWCGPGTCGAPCGTVVNGTRGCQNGRCVYTCNDNFLPLGGRCVHCGLVNEPPCDGPSPCVAGLTSCGDACRNLLADRAHCGTCPAACAASQNCVNGVCR